MMREKEVAAKMTAAAEEGATIPRRAYSVNSGPSMYLCSKSDEPIVRRLWSMVQELKNMDATWRRALSTLPNANEQSLYMLILGHVSSDIFLFHHENNLKLPHTPEDEMEWIVKEVRGRSNEEENESDSIDTAECTDKLYGSWQSVEELLQYLLASRDSICALPQGATGEELEVAQSTILTIDGDVNTVEGKNDEQLLEGKIPEDTLREILCGLGCRRQERSYAAPVGEELMCYREIRKWVSSTLSFIKAKYAWLWSWGDWWEGDEHGNDFAALRMQLRSSWEYILDEGASMGPLFRAPKGHDIAVIFDELSEFRSLVSDWKQRFSNICIARFQGEKSMDLSINVGVNAEVVGRKRTQVRQEVEAKEKRKYNLNVVDTAEVTAQSFKTAPLNDKTTTNNHIDSLKVVEAAGMAAQNCMSAPKNDKPIASLRDILAIFEEMGYPSYSPTVRELRLYYQVMDHVRSSIWLFLARESPGERRQRLQLMRDEKSEANKDCKLSIPVLEVPNLEQKTRECYLQELLVSAVPEVPNLEQKTRECYLEEIVRMLGRLEPVHLLSPPNCQEYLLYLKIHVHISKDLRQSSYYLKHEADGSTGIEHPNFTAKVGLARRVLKSTFEREVEVASWFEKHIGDTLVSIFTMKPPEETKVTEWLMEYMDEAVRDLKELADEDTGRLEFFDNLLLSMQEVKELFGNLLLKFLLANHEVCHALNAEKLYQVPLMEGWSSKNVRYTLV